MPENTFIFVVPEWGLLGNIRTLGTTDVININTESLKKRRFLFLYFISQLLIFSNATADERQRKF